MHDLPKDYDAVRTALLEALSRGLRHGSNTAPLAWVLGDQLDRLFNNPAWKPSAVKRLTDDLAAGYPHLKILKQGPAPLRALHLAWKKHPKQMPSIQEAIQRNKRSP
jgi:hypothetical protein